MSKSSESIQNEFKWVALEEEKNQYFMGNVQSKAMKNPFIPIGVLITTGILFAGLRSFYKREHRKQQTLMRSRVLAQGLTIAAAVGGIFFSDIFK